MKYVLLLVDTDPRPFEERSEAEIGEEMAKHGEFDEACRAREGVTLHGGEALAPGSAATTLRTRDGEMTVTDGPFAEVAELLGAYYVVEAPDLDTVIDLCTVLPPYDIDIRPVLDMG